MPPPRPMHIFVVDDERIISGTLTTILNWRGYPTRGFVDPIEALCAARLDAPDLLISDIAMPHLSGVELAIQIKAASPACRVLLISAQAGTIDLLPEARELGHEFDLFPKPLHPTDLLRKVMKIQVDRELESSGPVRPLRGLGPAGNLHFVRNLSGVSA